MSKPHHGAARRLQRLHRVLAARQRRLDATIARRAVPDVDRGALAGLRRYGYPVALVLAVGAALPTALGFAWRHRQTITRATATSLELRRWHERLDDLVQKAGAR